MYEELEGIDADDQDTRDGLQNIEAEDNIDFADAPQLDDDIILSTPRTQESSQNGNEPVDDESPIEPTRLGKAIDSLMMHWCQLLTNVSVRAPVPPPSTLDHVKEVAEVCSKHFSDAAVDVNNEFARLGIQWEMEQHNEQFAVEDMNLDEAIERQERLIEGALEIVKSRSENYHSNNPLAGKCFNT